MTITTWPIDAVAAVPGRQLREAHSVYMAGGSAADPFGVRSGVRPGTSPTTVTATSTTWTVGAHAGVVDLQPAVEASGYAYSVNATGGLPSGPVTAADLTRPRVDIVWVRNDDPSEGDASPNPTVVFGYTAGAPLAGTPLPPATPARCMVLATIQVPMSGGGSPTVIWVAPKAVAAGVLDPAVTAAAGISGPITVAWVAVVTAPAVTGDGVKKFLITFTYQEAYSTVSGDVCQFAIRNGALVAGPYQNVPLTAVWANGRTLSVFDTPAAGVVTYAASAYRAAGTGTITVGPSQIIVQQIA